MTASVHALHDGAMALTDDADARRRSGSHRYASIAFSRAAELEQEAADRAENEKDRAILTASAEALRNNAQQERQLVEGSSE